MRVQIKATGLFLTPSIEEYARKKVATLEKYLSSKDPENALVSIEIGKTTNHHKSGEIFKAEIFLRESGKEYYVVSEKTDLYEAIDDVRDEIIREITSWKGRARTIFRKGGAKIKNLIKRLNWKNNK